VTQVAVVGPGAIGATVAAAVRDADVLLCGRTPHERLVVEREGGHTRIVAGPVITDPAARRVAGLIDGVELAADFTTLAWRKLAINAVAGVMVLSGRRAGMFRRPGVKRVARALAAETLAVARAEGADLPDAVADELVDEFAGYPEDLGSSILFDYEAGRELEWDARNGVVSRLGARHGIPTPISDAIVPLLAAASGP
jgi:2-dehydropantoate 2-reductase